MMNTLKKLVLPLYKKYRFLGYFKSDRSKLSFLKRLWCLRKGFFPRNYILYEFPKNDYRDYITDYEEYARLDHINQETSYINNKVLFTDFINTQDDIFLAIAKKLNSLNVEFAINPVTIRKEY